MFSVREHMKKLLFLAVLVAVAYKFFPNSFSFLSTPGAFDKGGSPWWWCFSSLSRWPLRRRARPAQAMRHQLPDHRLSEIRWRTQRLSIDLGKLLPLFRLRRTRNTGRRCRAEEVHARQGWLTRASSPATAGSKWLIILSPVRKLM